LSLFELTHVGYSYANQIEALRDITLSVDLGEQVSIMGANGCGKSTLLKILGGLIFPTAGEIHAFDQLLTAKLLTSVDGGKFAQMFRKRIGILFQNSDVQLFCPTVFDEIAFGPIQLDLPTEEVAQRVEEIMGMLEIEELRNRSPYTLSGGEKKRVAIASVLSVNPDVLLLDEPTSALDPRTQSWFEDLLHTLGKNGKTIILATHDLDIVDAISQRVIVMGEDHQIAASGEKDVILEDHELLLRVNLIHEHYHQHGEVWHKHDEEWHKHTHNMEE
jgi:cobalt/nickel transport system ATP-binding protein